MEDGEEPDLRVCCRFTGLCSLQEQPCVSPLKSASGVIVMHRFRWLLPQITADFLSDQLEGLFHAAWIPSQTPANPHNSPRSAQLHYKYGHFLNERLEKSTGSRGTLTEDCCEWIPTSRGHSEEVVWLLWKAIILWDYDLSIQSYCMFSSVALPSAFQECSAKRAGESHNNKDVTQNACPFVKPKVFIYEPGCLFFFFLTTANNYLLILF